MTIQTDLHERVLTVTMDDGAANALNPDMFAGIAAALEAAGEDVGAIVIAGRERYLSAGLDLKYMLTAGIDGITQLLLDFGRTWMQVWTDPRPTVLAATGHCIAGGTMLALACDHVVAAEGDWVWGLNETQLGMLLPEFSLALARANLRSDRLEDLLLPGRKVSVTEAVEVGFADEATPLDQVLPRAQEVAAELALLPAHAYAGNKQRLRGAAADAALANLDADVASLIAHLPTG